MEYLELYRKRLNRYGLDYQSRVQGQRDRNFDNYLLKTIYRVDFWYNDIYVPASLERYKQDYTETQGYLLTQREVEIPNGTILEIESQDGKKQMWMVWWLEHIESSGYNKYVVLKMTHKLTWRDANKKEHSQWGYFSGPGTSTISDTIKSASGEAIYKENNNLHMFITGYNSNIVRDTYFEVTYKDTDTAYVVSELDVNSTPGVAYITVDPSYIRDKSSETGTAQSAADYWFNGGEE
jgi:hypothetical protein